MAPVDRLGQESSRYVDCLQVALPGRPGSGPAPPAPPGVTDKRRETLTTFKELGALPEIVEALERVGISEPFPIQQMAIPIALTGADLIAQARTGTGKTLAFGVPLLQRIVGPSDRDFPDLDAPGKPQALVVAPTRELALQVTADIAVAGSIRKARVLTVYGGVGYEPQLDALKAGVEVVVGTPGRLLDLADRRALSLAHVKVLVLDEADRMLDLGFLPDVERLIRLTHELRQTMLFSATMPGDVVQLARRHMRHPVNVRAESADESQIVPATAQFVYRCHDMDKAEVIARILQAESRGRVMIFCTTKRAAQRVADDLADRGFSAAGIHGDLGQIARERALERFRSGKVDVLVATDVAARGIDVEGVTHVVNHTCPDDDKTYVHRIGRTGRAGASGIAVTFVDWQDIGRWKVINATLGLPFDDPVETYSTSDHLFHDLGIPKETTGTVGPPRAEGPRPRVRDDSGEGRAGRSRRGSSDRTRGERHGGRPARGREHGDADRGGRADRADRGDRGDRGDRADHGGAGVSADRDGTVVADPAEAREGRSNRRRRRTRSGVVVAEREGGKGSPSGSVADPRTDGGDGEMRTQDQGGSGTQPGDTDGASPRARRRGRSRVRRRRRGSDQGADGATSGDEGSVG